MTTIRQHLQEVHKAAAEHHAALADHSSKLEECFSGMGKAAGEPDGAMYHKVASHFGAMAKVHADASDAHAGFASDCEKAAEADLNKRVPDSISSVIPSDVPAFGIRSVPRTGQPDLAKTIARVPEQFRHLVSMDE